MRVAAPWVITRAATDGDGWQESYDAHAAIFDQSTGEYWGGVLHDGRKLWVLVEVKECAS